jgi:hypothetical protein
MGERRKIGVSWSDRMVKESEKDTPNEDASVYNKSRNKAT